MSPCRFQPMPRSQVQVGITVADHRGRLESNDGPRNTAAGARAGIGLHLALIARSVAAVVGPA
jgi:hypothetical protein